MEAPSRFKEVDFKGVVTGIYVSADEIVVCGIPNEDDEEHNCDQMGCSSVSHVLAIEAI